MSNGIFLHLHAIRLSWVPCLQFFALSCLHCFIQFSFIYIFQCFCFDLIGKLAKFQYTYIHNEQCEWERKTANRRNKSVQWIQKTISFPYHKILSCGHSDSAVIFCFCIQINIDEYKIYLVSKNSNHISWCRLFRGNFVVVVLSYLNMYRPEELPHTYPVLIWLIAHSHMPFRFRNNCLTFFFSFSFSLHSIFCTHFHSYE